MSPQELVAELEKRRVRPLLRSDGGVKLRGPQHSITPDLVDEARKHKDLLLSIATANEAIALLRRLQILTLPDGRLPVARILASRLTSIEKHGDDGIDPAEALAALRNLEIDLVGIGAQPDETLAAVLDAFPDAKVVAVQ